jgi:hypothetical protein
MPFDPKTLSPISRASYIKLGKQYGSSDTSAQADFTLLALKAHGPKLTAFSVDDGARLKEVRALLSDAINARSSAQGTSKVTNKAYLDALVAGKIAWLTGRTTLQNSRSDLLESNEPESAEALRALDAVLAQTHTAEKDAEKLANQLGTILWILDHTEKIPNSPLVAKVTIARGGAEAVVVLTRQIALLRDIAKQVAAPGTPTETEEMDLLDGIIVTLARKARKAAREADKKLGTKSLGKEFALKHLYRSTGKKKPKTEG